MRGRDLGIRLFDDALEARLRATLDLEWYQIETEPTGLLLESRPFGNFRFLASGEVFVGNFATGLVELRADRGIEPADQSAEARLQQGFARLSVPGLGDSATLSLQLGVFATPFGNFVSRSDSWSNPLVRWPLPYDHRTTLLHAENPFRVVFAANRHDLISWRSWREFPEDLWGGDPMIWQGVWGLGAMLFGSWGRFTGALALMNSALSGTPDGWTRMPEIPDDLNIHARIAARVEFGTWVGLSTSYGPWLPEDAQPFAPTRKINTFYQRTVGADLEFARGHMQTFAEVIYTVWEEPVGTLPTGWRGAEVSSLGSYLESRVKLVFLDPSLFVAARIGYVANGKIRDDTTGRRRRWDRDQARFELGLGYALGPETLLKVAFERNVTQGTGDIHDDTVLVQLALRT